MASTDSNPAYPAFWQSFYASGELPWDLGAPSPHIVRFFEDMALRASLGFPDPPASVFVPGAGRANDAVYAASLGYRVTCLDLAPDAPVRAKEAYPDYFPETVAYPTGDLFALAGDDDWKECFDIVLEHTCFCAIPPSRRDDYVQAAQWLLKPGGVLLGVFWENSRPEGPPFSVSEPELNQRFGTAFSLRYAQSCPQTAGGRDGREFVCLWQKNGDASRSTDG